VYNCFPFYLNFTNGERCINPIEATSSVLKHDRQEIFGIQRKVQETLLPLSNNDGYLFDFFYYVWTWGAGGGREGQGEPAVPFELYSARLLVAGVIQQFCRHDLVVIMGQFCSFHNLSEVVIYSQ
jgi:hypothetical protein